MHDIIQQMLANVSHGAARSERFSTELQILKLNNYCLKLDRLFTTHTIQH